MVSGRPCHEETGNCNILCCSLGIYTIYACMCICICNICVYIYIHIYDMCLSIHYSVLPVLLGLSSCKPFLT